MTRQLVKTAISIAAVAAILAAVAQPTMIITDGNVSSGPITGTNGSVVYVNPAFGDNWSVVITAGTSKPLFGSAISPDMELDIAATCTGPGSDLAVRPAFTSFGQHPVVPTPDSAT